MKQTLAAPNVNDDFGDTVPSRPQNIGVQGANEVPTSSNLSKQVSDVAELAAEGMTMHVLQTYYIV